MPASASTSPNRRGKWLKDSHTLLIRRSLLQHPQNMHSAKDRQHASPPSLHTHGTHSWPPTCTTATHRHPHPPLLTCIYKEMKWRPDFHRPPKNESPPHISHWRMERKGAASTYRHVSDSQPWIAEPWIVLPSTLYTVVSGCGRRRNSQ